MPNKDTTQTPEGELRSFVRRFDAKTQKLIRSLRAALRKRLPAANELAYDYGSSLVIGYSPTERGIEAVVAISARASGVSLFFNQGPKLPDPKKLLRGSGRQTRFIPLDSARRLSHPDVKALIGAAIDASAVPLPSRGKGALVIRSSAAKKKTRRRAAK